MRIIVLALVSWWPLFDGDEEHSSGAHPFFAQKKGKKENNHLNFNNSIKCHIAATAPAAATFQLPFTGRKNNNLNPNWWKGAHKKKFVRENDILRAQKTESFFITIC